MRPRKCQLCIMLAVVVAACSFPADGQQVYWSQYTTDPLVGRINVDGSGAATTLPLAHSPIGLAAVSQTRQIYWYEHDVGQIVRSNAELTQVTPVVNGLPASGVFNVAVDPAADLVFWTMGNSSIGRASLSSGNLLSAFPSPGTVPDGIAVDPAARKVYWETQSGGVFRANYDGSSRDDLVPDGAPGSGAIGIHLDLAAGMMYLAYPNSHRIARANLDGTGLTTVLTLSPAERPVGVDVFNGRMYWADFDIGRLRSAALDGTGVTTLLSGLQDPRAVAVLPALLPGDANGDGIDNFSDLLILAQHYGKSGALGDGDFNADGSVGFDDLLILAQHYGQTATTGTALGEAAVPEPAALAVIGVAGAAVVRRRVLGRAHE
jgi:hypothetical protein